MNPYAKIAIKIGVVIVISLVLLLAYNLLLHGRYVKQARKFRRQIAEQEEIERRIQSLLFYKDELPSVRQVQYQDMQTLRNLIPDADEFVLTTYLRLIHRMLNENHLETGGINIAGSGSATGGTDFEETFSSDVTALQTDLENIVESLEFFKEKKGEMNNLLVSFDFYEKLATEAENFAAIAGGIEQHVFTLNVSGSYTDIKKFTYDVFNMRPHTALVNFQMRPAGPGFGPTRQYNAGFRLITYGDANTPPPLWLAKNQGNILGIDPEEGAEEDNLGDEEADNEGAGG